MKRILTTMALITVVILGSSVRNNVSAQQPSGDDSYQQGQTGDVSYQTFYDDLSPYGRWIDYPDYGYVWQPNEGPDFRPYSTAGHWAYSDDYQWMWVSDYDWGWAPFHYGRWFSDPAYGWLWMPGYEWAPAWVAWRSGGDFYGWAPLMPGFDLGVDLSLGNYYAPDDYWCFAPSRYITSPNIYDYCIDRRRNLSIINSTVIINNFGRNRNVFVTGPRRAEVEGFLGQRLTSVRFRDSFRPGRSEFRNNEVSFYRPNIQRNNNRYTPRQFDRYNRSAQTNNNGIVRNNDNTRRDNGNERSNNLPERQRFNDNSSLNRMDNNNRNDQRRPDMPGRNDVNNQAPVRNNNTNQFRQQTDRAVTTRPNNDNRFNDRIRSDNAPVRQQMPETRNDNNRFQQQQQQQQQRQQQQQPRQQQQEQPRQQQQQQQPRQFERHDNGSRDQNSSNNNQGRRRF